MIKPNETLLLRSQTGIVYILSILIFFIFGLLIFVPCSKSTEFLLRFIAIIVSSCWLIYSINVILSIRIFKFFETYLTITYWLKQKTIHINYNDLNTFHYGPNTTTFNGRVGGKSENDKIVITTLQGKKIELREMQFDNFSSIRVIFQKIIRGENLS